MGKVQVHCWLLFAARRSLLTLLLMACTGMRERQHEEQATTVMTLAPTPSCRLQRSRLWCARRSGMQGVTPVAGGPCAWARH